jgi:phosphoribosyl 1,2-cyclic phosphodiesterase
VRVRVWGVRGSQASPGPETVRYGGNTSCVEVRASPGHVVVLDAGTGLRRLGEALDPTVERIDILLTHLHLDHIQGLGFFRPLHDADVDLHIWGPPSATFDLRSRLGRYMSPPLFPVRLRDLAGRLALHDAPREPFELPGLTVQAMEVSHPGPTIGYRLTDVGGRSLTYLPDHEPALGVASFPRTAAWTSGHDLAAGVDLLVHDAQYTDGEYAERVGWGHSALSHAMAFADLCGVGRLMPFHFDPSHDDDFLDDLFAGLPVLPAREGLDLELSTF